MKNCLLLFLVFFGCQPWAQAQIAQRVEHTLPSSIYGKQQRVTVYMPVDYEQQPKQRYHVLYVFDKDVEEVTAVVAHTNSYLAKAKASQQLLVVGVQAGALMNN
jgi:enterochelin esterase-like enzyme